LSLIVDVANELSGRLLFILSQFEWKNMFSSENKWLVEVLENFLFGFKTLLRLSQLAEAAVRCYQTHFN
jgi:hypothetical protein